MRLAREEKKGRFIAMITIFVCLTAVFIFTLAKSQIIDGKKDTASNTASVESGRSGTGRYLSSIEKSGQAYL